MDVRDYQASEKLRDGRSLRIRAITPGDKTLLNEGVKHLSEESRYFRFFSYRNNLSDKDLKYFTEVDFKNRVALIAEIELNGNWHFAGVARYIVADQSQPDRAELAVTVGDEFHHLGVATALSHHLSDIARSNGVKELLGFVLPDNVKALESLASLKGKVEKSFDNDDGVWQIRYRLNQ